MRYPQGGLHGLCTTCAKETGVAIPQRIARGHKAHQRRAPLQAAPSASIVYTERRTVTAEGEEYEVVWDGSMGSLTSPKEPL